MYSKTIQKKTAALIPARLHKAQKRCCFYTISVKAASFSSSYIILYISLATPSSSLLSVIWYAASFRCSVAFFIAIPYFIFYYLLFIPYFTDRIISRSLSASQNAIASSGEISRSFRSFSSVFPLPASAFPISRRWETDEVT